MTDDRTEIPTDRPTEPPTVSVTVRRLRAQLILTVVSLVLDACLMVQRTRRYRDARTLDRRLTAHRSAR